MTIQEYKEQCDSSNENFFDFISQVTEIWKNNSCLGYTIEALKNLNFSDESISMVVNKMRYCFEEITTDEADQIYCSSKY